jgi:hypothetical protein
MANEKTPAEALHAAGFERLKQQLAREQPADPRDVGRPQRVPVLREGESRLPPDNVPTQPPEKK